MSRNHLPHQLNHPPTPAHNHQSTNHEHLQSLTTTIQKLTHLSHSLAGLKIASYSMLVDAYLSARPSWNSSLPVETQVYVQLELFILLPVHPLLSLLCWKPSLVILNKLPFDLHLPVCLLDQCVTTTTFLVGYSSIYAL